MKKTKYIHKIHCYILLGYLTILSVSAQDNRTLETKISDILAKYPAKNNENTYELSQKIIELGNVGIEKLTDMLTPQGKGDDTQVRYAVKSLAQYCSSPENNENTNFVEKSLLKAIEKAKHYEVKIFLIRRLNYCATDISTQFMGDLLSDTKLYSSAIGVLTSIGTASAGDALLKEIHHKKAQLEIIKALGVIKYDKAIPKITKLTSSKDIKVQKEALYTLSKIASPDSKKVLSVAFQKEKFEIAYNDATTSYIEYAKNLGINGNRKLSKKVCNEIIKKTTSEDQLHIRSAAYSILRDNFKGDVTKDLLKEAKTTTNKKYRKAIFSIANRGMDSKELKSWLKIFKKLTNEGKAQLLNSLSQRRENIVFEEAIIPTLESNDEALRLEAIRVLSINQKEKAIPILINLLKKERSKKEFLAIKGALQKVMGAKNTDALIHEFNEFSEYSKIISIQLLKEKRATQHFDFVSKLTITSKGELKKTAYSAIANLSTAKNFQQLIELLSLNNIGENIEKIQTALYSIIADGDDSLKKQFLSVFKSGDISKEKLLPIFPAINSKEGLHVVKEELESTNIKNKRAAIKAVLLWKNEDVLPIYYDFISKGEGNINQIFTEYLSKIDYSHMPADQKLLWVRKLTPFAKSDEQVGQILKSAGNIKTFLSLVFVSDYLEGIYSQKAMRAVVSIVLPKFGEQSNFYGNIVRNIVKKVILNLEGPNSRYIKIDLKEFLDNMPNDKGYISIFNGKDLSGWQGLVKNPIERSKMSKKSLSIMQSKANKQMLKDWFVKDGTISFKGEGYNNICTVKNYKDFEMLVDWKISNGGDSGIYLRGTPQVQIWDTKRADVGAEVGSGGLYNNQKNPSTPLVFADNPINEWNTFRIKMVSDRVTVYLNGILVTKNVILENYWDRSIRIFPEGPIELQAHGENSEFRNIYVREINTNDYGLTKEEKNDGFVSLFNGKDLDHWIGNKTDYLAQDNMILVRPRGGHENLYTINEYSDFVFRFEFQLTPGANNGLGIHAPLEGDAAYVGKELQILDNERAIYRNLKPYQYHGSVYGVMAAKVGYLKPVGEWNSQEVVVKGDYIKVTLNGVVILEGDLKEASKNGTADNKDHPGLKRHKGHIGFLGHGSELQFRNIRIKDLSK